MILYLEVWRHPAFAVHAMTERDRFQIAAQVVAPGMVDALKILSTDAGIIQADQGAAMRTAILERGNRPVGIAGDHYRHPADDGRPPVAGIGDRVFQA